MHEKEFRVSKIHLSNGYIFMIVHNLPNDENDTYIQSAFTEWRLQSAVHFAQDFVDYLKSKRRFEFYTLDDYVDICGRKGL